MQGLKFYVNAVPGSRTPAGWPAGGITTENQTPDFSLTNEGNGTAKFTCKISGEGDYQFTAYCSVVRKFPGYLEGTSLLDSLKVMVGALTDAQSNSDAFTIRAKRQGGVVKKTIQEL
jgi:hypothetical protein